MKIERDGDDYLVSSDGNPILCRIRAADAHALVRLGMEAQRERDAKFMEGYDNPVTRRMSPEAAVNAALDAKAIRAIPTEDRHASYVVTSHIAALKARL